MWQKLFQNIQKSLKKLNNQIYKTQKIKAINILTKVRPPLLEQNKKLVLNYLNIFYQFFCSKMFQKKVGPGWWGLISDQQYGIL